MTERSVIEITALVDGADDKQPIFVDYGIFFVPSDLDGHLDQQYSVVMEQIEARIEPVGNDTELADDMLLVDLIGILVVDGMVDECIELVEV